MELWVVAAAAGAGYIAKNLQNCSVDRKENPTGLSSKNIQSEPKNFLQQLRDQTCPLRRLARKRPDTDDFLLQLENHSEAGNMGSISSLPSTYCLEKKVKLEDGKAGRNMTRVVTSKGCPLRPISCLDLQVFKEDENTCLYPCMLTSSPLEPFESVESKSKKVSGDSQDGCILFITGMSIGILSATTSWKNEVDKLNKQLNQMQNLVQDLQEDLDMKEMLMVKELGYQEINMPRSLQEPIASPSDDKKIDNLELLSKVEAELQAELEMLEYNLKTSTLDPISTVVELDIAQGDLKPISGDATSSSENETSETVSNCSQPANYAVCPWELSLRLHELIESRLETRVKELELALHISQDRVQSFGSQRTIFGRRFSYSGTQNLPSDQTYKCLCNECVKRYDGPLTEDFIGDAYKEEKEDKALMINQISNGDSELISKKNVIMEEDRSSDLVRDMSQVWDKRISTNFISGEDCSSEDDDGSDESDLLLIKKIVERRRSGSSLNLIID